MSDYATALVTGASSGIGLEIARQLLSNRYKVVLVSRSLEKLEAGISSFEDHGNEAATAWALPLPKDLSTLSGCQEAMKEAVSMLGGRLDLLVNNAGASEGMASIMETSPEAWQRCLNLNLNSAIHLSTAAQPHLKQTKGCIVNISSIAGKRPMPSFAPYCVAKAGMDMLTQCCALEWASQGIRVNGINPATVATDFHASAGFSPDFYDRMTTAHPIGRIGTTADIASMCLFLACSEKSGWITGQNYTLDGGRMLPIKTATV